MSASSRRWPTRRKSGATAPRFLTAAQAAELHPLLDPESIAGAWLNELSGRVNPADLTACYARAARRSGAEIREMCQVRALVERNGAVAAVETADGTVDADTVVVCGGLWSADLVRPLGIDLAQVGCQHFYVIADVAPRLARETPSFVSPRDMIYGREEVGGLLVGCFDEKALCLEPGQLPEPFTFTLLEPNWDKFAPYFEPAMELFPSLREAPVRQFVNGPESFTPDGDPLVGALGEVEGLYVCSGMNSRGVTISGASGHTIADLIEGVPPRFATSMFDPGRFGDKPSDDDWLRREVSDTPSRYYRHANTL